MKHICKYYYIDTNGIPLFTMVALPEENGRFPAVIYRSPYVDEYEEASEDDICTRLLEARKPTNTTANITTRYWNSTATKPWNSL